MSRISVPLRILAAEMRRARSYTKVQLIPMETRSNWELEDRIDLLARREKTPEQERSLATCRICHRLSGAQLFLPPAYLDHRQSAADAGTLVREPVDAAVRYAAIGNCVFLFNSMRGCPVVGTDALPRMKLRS